MYLFLKHLHITTVVLSIALFALRGAWQFKSPERASAPWLRLARHSIDTVLLGAALGMLWVAQLNPLDQPWLLGKFVALVVYVGLGSVALRRGRPWAYAAAMLTVAWIVMTALTKRPWPL